MNNLAVLLVRANPAVEALPLMVRSATIDDRKIGQTFSLVSDARRIEYLDGIRIYLDAFLTLIRFHIEETPATVRDALDVLLRRKAIGAEVLLVQREAVPSSESSHLNRRFTELASSPGGSHERPLMDQATMKSRHISGGFPNGFVRKSSSSQSWRVKFPK